MIYVQKAARVGSFMISDTGLLVGILTFVAYAFTFGR